MLGPPPSPRPSTPTPTPMIKFFAILLKLHCGHFDKECIARSKVCDVNSGKVYMIETYADLERLHCCLRWMAWFEQSLADNEDDTGKSAISQNQAHASSKACFDNLEILTLLFRMATLVEK